jgi:AhpD family alkylhydroperoxidase
MSAAPPAIFAEWPSGVKAMLAVDAACDAQGLPPRLLELVRLWCSILNKCDFCIDMHRTKALAAGAPSALLADIIEQRSLTALAEDEQAALALATALTVLKHDAVMAEAKAALTQHFDQHQIITLTYVIAQINAWNRLARFDEAAKIAAPEILTSGVS